MPAKTFCLLQMLCEGIDCLLDAWGQTQMVDQQLNLKMF